MLRWPAGLIALALLPLGGCAVDDPAAGEPLLVISGPKSFERLELRDQEGQVIWRLVADPPAPLAQLVHGAVPAGFRQDAPAGGVRPRELIPGEPLILESITPLRVFHHEGFAAFGQQFEIYSWEMKLRNPPARLVENGGPAAGASMDGAPIDP